MGKYLLTMERLNYVHTALEGLRKLKGYTTCKYNLTDAREFKYLQRLPVPKNSI